MPLPGADLLQAMTGETRASVKPNAPFLLVHWAGKMGSWELVEDGPDGPELLPVLAQIPLRPGCNHFRGAEVGEDPTRPVDEAIAAFQREGAVVLPSRSEVCGVRWLAHTPTVGGGHRWRLWCEKVEPNPFPGRKDLTSIDWKAYNAWRRRLVVEGVLPAIHPAVRQEMERGAKRARDRWRANNRAAPALRETQLARHQARMDALASARIPTDRHAPTTVEKPARGRRASAEVADG